MVTPTFCISLNFFPKSLGIIDTEGKKIIIIYTFLKNWVTKFPSGQGMIARPSCFLSDCVSSRDTTQFFIGESFLAVTDTVTTPLIGFDFAFNPRDLYCTERPSGVGQLSLLTHYHRG